MADNLAIQYRIGDTYYWLNRMEPLKLIAGQTLVITRIYYDSLEIGIEDPFVFTLDSDGKNIAFFRENPSIRGKKELIVIEAIKAGTGLLKIYYRGEFLTYVNLTAYNPYLSS